MQIVIAELRAEGIIADATSAETTHVEIHHAGGGSSVPIVHTGPKVGESYTHFQLLQPDVEADRLLPVELMVEGLEDLLGERGLRCMRESRRALRRGLYLASASLLAAASEAAWFRLGNRVAEPGSSLAKKVEAGQPIAGVITQTAERLRNLGATPAVVTEVVAEAHRFRDIRNYALHPVTGHDQDRETWLTEAGATVLTIACRTYFVKLADLMRLASAGADRPNRDVGPRGDR